MGRDVPADGAARRGACDSSAANTSPLLPVSDELKGSDLDSLLILMRDWHQEKAGKLLLPLAKGKSLTIP